MSLSIGPATMEEVMSPVAAGAAAVAADVRLGATEQRQSGPTTRGDGNLTQQTQGVPLSGGQLIGLLLGALLLTLAHVTVNRVWSELQFRRRNGHATH